MSIGARIKQIREAKGLLQKELADRLHVTPEAISQWETDRRTKGFERIANIAQALGVSESELIGADQSDFQFLSQLGFAPDDLTGFTSEQVYAMRAALLSLMTTFREQIIYSLFLELETVYLGKFISFSRNADSFGCILQLFLRLIAKELERFSK